MSLKTFTIPKENVQLPGDDSFVVRGVSLNDVTTLVEKFRPDLEQMFDQFQNAENLSLEEGADVAFSMLQSAPRLVAYLIALASSEHDDDSPLSEIAETVLGLTAGVQVDALEKIGRLTFEDQSPKKLIEAVMRAMAGGRKMIDEFSDQGASTQVASTTGTKD